MEFPGRYHDPMYQEYMEHTLYLLSKLHMVIAMFQESMKNVGDIHVRRPG
jgi:hypothetical protein